MRHPVTKIITLTMALGFIATALLAQNHHEAHVHGEASMNIAFEKGSLYIEFSSPAANIVGFEHPPRTQKQKNAIKKATNSLKQADQIFLFDSTAKVILKKARVNTDIAPHQSGHDSKKSSHEHHSNFTASYQFTCHQPKALTSITVRLFKPFPRIGKIRVQLLTDTKQTAIVLKPLKNKIEWN